MDTVLDGLAENPALPSRLLDRLVAIADGVMSLELARRDDLTPAHVRTLLARDDHAVVHVLLSQGLVAPSDVPLTDPWVALAVTEHPSSDPAVARSLSVHPDHEIRVRLPERAHRLPPDVIDRLAHDPDEWVVAELVHFHPLPVALAEELSGHPSIEVRRFLAGSPHTPAHVLVRLSGEDGLSARLATNPATPAPIAADLVRHPSVHLWLASRTDLPPEVYSQLATNPRLHPELAANPAVPGELLRQLEESRAVHRALVKNPAVPLDLLVEVSSTERIGPFPVPRVASASEAELRMLASSSVVSARVLVAERADLPADVFARLLDDPSPGVAAAIVTNPAVTVDQLRSLVSRHGPRLHPWAARNPLCPPDLLHQMAEHAEAEEKTYRAIARHPQARGETLLLCLHDPQARHLAACHPNLPPPMIVELLASEFTARPAAANPSLPVSVMEELLENVGS
ncbi:hypothetical protein ACIA8G_31400 [Lentzea sp. NPDC051213]|uniref:hypothetical protein n=1 Tax=Lentzea sp. NPDC051213 TaxID=3364126 RepID=UPI00379E4E28